MDLSVPCHVQICLNATSTCGYIHGALYTCIKSSMVYHTKCIKRVGGFPNKIMVLVSTLGIDVALTTKLD